MIALLEKIWPSRGKMLIIITGKGRVRNLFDVKVVWLIETLGQDLKYGIGPVGGHVVVSGRV